LRVTGLLVNTHLMEDTTPEIVIEGWRLARRVSERNGIPVRCVAVREALMQEPALIEINVPILRLQRTMLPPWARTTGGV
jgi:hypothetical protein